MEKFLLEPTEKTPHVFFDPDEGIFEIGGRSIIENTVKFYEPIFDWIEAYLEKPALKNTIMAKFEYFNTSSSKCLIEIFRKFEGLHKKGIKVHLEWYYEQEDEDMRESGEDFRTVLSFPLSIKEMKVI
ncbi:MAG: DUF1987 domain-containing protein [Cytophagales bacterium]|nr:DUF1987 domain-containing protein [Cytophagales bacterium]